MHQLSRWPAFMPLFSASKLKGWSHRELENRPPNEAARRKSFSISQQRAFVRFGPHVDRSRNSGKAYRSSKEAVDELATQVCDVVNAPPRDWNRRRCDCRRLAGAISHGRSAAWFWRQVLVAIAFE